MTAGLTVLTTRERFFWGSSASPSTYWPASFPADFCTFSVNTDLWICTLQLIQLKILLKLFYSIDNASQKIFCHIKAHGDNSRGSCGKQNSNRKKIWPNSLLKTVLNSDSLAVFKSRLKTFLFSQAFSSFSAHWHAVCPQRLWSYDLTALYKSNYY